MEKCLLGFIHLPLYERGLRSVKNIKYIFPDSNYALNSGIDWSYFSSETVPAGWWSTPAFRSELLKFWGSLGRVVLAFFGISGG